MADQHLCAALIERTRTDPDALFAVVLTQGHEHRVTQRDVLARAVAVGGELRVRGVAEGGLVAIVLEHCADQYPAFLGCLLHGFVPSFLPPLTVKQDPALFRAGMLALFGRIAPAAVLTSARSLADVPAGGWPVLRLDDIATDPQGGVAALARRQMTGGGTAFLQHSSGTTGLKKGVMLSHRAVLRHIALYAAAIGAEPGDTVASWLPLYHDMGLITAFLLPVVLGGAIVSLDALEWVARPAMLFDAAERWQARFIHLPNFAFHHLLRGAPPGQAWDLSSLKAVVNCSEPCRAATFDLFAARFGGMGLGREKLRVCYAMAEAVFAVTCTAPGHAAPHGRSEATLAYLSSGTPLPGAALAIRDADGRAVADGEVGEICIRSDTLFDGYFRQPEETALRLRDGWFHTSDLGCIEPDGLLVLGRIDDLLVVNGRNLFAHEIEDVLTATAGLAAGRTLACAPFHAALGAARLTILAEPEADMADAAALAAAIRQTVLAHTGVFPAVVEIVPPGFLVKSTSGKLARAASVRKWRQRQAGA